MTALMLALLGVIGAGNAAAATNGKVLILSTTVTGDAGSREAQAAIAAGHGVEIATPAQWAAKTTADFAQYDALILGDPTCGGPGTAPWIGAAEANRTVWSPAINGNMLVIGTDEVYHHYQGGSQLTTSAVKFAADAAGKTGLMVSLSCYYHNTPPLTPIPLLDQFGTGFKASGVGCYNNAHIVATHPALAGLTDTSLSNWSCSVHEAISDRPTDFLPLAIARGVAGPGSMTFPDGSFGIPYIVARGEGLRFISTISLAPETATNPVGTRHTVTATVVENDKPVAGALVTFTITSGPNAGTIGTGTTNASGQATFTWSSLVQGTDRIEASYVDSKGVRKTSNPATKEWKVGPPETLTLTQKTDTNTVGQEHCVAATVLDAAGTPIPGVTVHFDVSGANPTTGDKVTDPSGTATFCYTGTRAGDDTITATAQGGKNPSAHVMKRYLAGSPFLLVLSPKVATNVVGDAHTVTATVTDKYGNPTPNVSVVFSVTGANTASGTSTTNASGAAAFTYTGLHFGADVITAFADSNKSGTQDAGEPSDSAAKTWTLAPLDHFKCYKVGGNDGHEAGAQGQQSGQHDDGSAKVVATLKDQFGTTTVAIDSPSILCNPVDKNGEGIITKTAHLVGFMIHRLDGEHQSSGDSTSKTGTSDHGNESNRFVEVMNQFSPTPQVLQVNDPKLLLVPSSKALLGTVPGAIPITVNHFLCYAIDGKALAPKPSVVLVDQFGTEQVTVGPARLLCNPAEKTVGATTTGIGPVGGGGADHLVCYAIKGPGESDDSGGQTGDFTGQHDDGNGSAKVTVTVRNQFGLQTLSVGGRLALCVPSTKREIPPPADDHGNGGSSNGGSDESSKSSGS